MRTMHAPAMVLATLMAVADGAPRYSFEANSHSIFRADLAPPRAAVPAPLRPLAVEPVTDGTDAASRARSWFDSATGRFCLGTQLNRRCR